MPAEITLLRQPNQIRRMAVRNRIVMSSAITNMAAPDGSVTDQMIAYYAERGRGGAGIVNTGYNFICQRGRAGVFQMSTAADANIPSMRRMTDAFHALAPRGTNIGSQLCHAGRQATRNVTGLPPEGPSPLVGPIPTGYSKEMPEEMSILRIREVIDEFAQAARRSKEAGFDLVEVHAAHGYLLSQFLSPFSNQRADEYGGSFEKRLRIVLEVLEAVRGTLGGDFPVGVRINGDDMIDGGYTLEDYRGVAKAIEEAGFADYISVSAGLHHPDGVAAMVAPMAMPMGFLEHLGAGIRSAIQRIPVFIVGRIKDPVLAEGILKRGSADHVIMTRALMADPQLPNKVMEDRLDDIRPCLACMQGCTDRTWAQLDLSCLINPAAGRERTWAEIKPAQARKRVLVVGGGPAGMEAARLAALRGHAVTLWEQALELGGAARLAAIPPRREEFGELTRWLSGQLPKAGVKVELGRRADKASVVGFAPDVLVAASGARPVIPESIPGWNMAHVTNIYDLLSGKSHAGARVLVSGAPVQAWEDPEKALANDVNGFTGRYVMMGFVKERINFLPFKMVKAIEKDAVLLSATGEQHPCATQTRIGELCDERLAVDTVVVHLRMRSVRDWMDGLTDGLTAGQTTSIPEVHLIGDCLEPRKAIDAMADGGRIGRML